MELFVMPLPHFSSFRCVLPQIQNIRIILEFFSTDLHFLCMTNVYLVGPTSNINTNLAHIYNINMSACPVAQSCSTVCNPMDCNPTGSFCPWDFPGKNTGLSCHVLFQDFLPTPESNPGLLHLLYLLHWQEDCLPPSHLGYLYMNLEGTILPSISTNCIVSLQNLLIVHD